jgi:hypothetical protein
MAKREPESKATNEFTGLNSCDHAWIEMKSVFGSDKARFKGMITSFSDSFNSSWNEEPVFARMDPIATFQRTSRKISLTFKVVSVGVFDAEHNLAQVQRLIRMMYPMWDDESYPTPQAAPLIDIKFSNLMRSTSNKDNWLSGYIGGLNVVHEVDAGFLFAGKNQDLMIPKEITLSFDFTVLHDHLLGASVSGGVEKFGGGKYPYGAGKNTQLGDVKGNAAKAAARAATEAAATAAAASSAALKAAQNNTIVASADDGSSHSARIAPTTPGTEKSSATNPGVIHGGGNDPERVRAAARNQALTGGGRPATRNSRPALKPLGEAPGPSTTPAIVPGIGVKKRLRLEGR